LANAKHYIALHSYDVEGTQTEHNSEKRAELNNLIGNTSKPDEIQNSFKRLIRLYNRCLSMNELKQR
jgi:hypothetical protein